MSINKNEQKLIVSPLESSTDILSLIREDLYKFVFMPIPKQFTSFIRCHLRRHKFDILQTFELEIEYGDDEKSVIIPMEFSS